MFCEFCGKKLSDDANFCTDCGNMVKQSAPVINDIGATAVLEPEVQSYDYGATEVLEPEIQIEPKVIYEPEVVSQPQVSDVVTEPRIESYTQTSVKESSPAKTASICAIFAPVSILLVAILSQVLTGIFNALGNELSRDYDSLWYFTIQFGNFLSSFLGLGIYIGSYLIFSGRKLSKLPFFAFLLAPGCSVLLGGITNLFYGIFWDTEISQTIIYLFFINIQALISYFVVRGVFKKILSNKA